jgi:hypothetical protein
MGHSGHELIEAIAAAVIVIGGAVFTAISFLTRPARTGPAAFCVPEPPRPDAAPAIRRSLVLIMAGLSAGAAVIHLVAAPPHYLEIGDLASGFVIAAAFQAWWAVRALGGLTRRLVDIGIVVNVAIVVAWAWTRTVGLPVGELAGSPEPIGLPDAACSVFELLLVGLLVVCRRGLDVEAARRSWARPLASIAVVPVLGLVVVLTSLSMVALAAGLDHGAPSGAPGQHVAGH